MSKWQMVKLGEVCDVRDGTHDSPKYQETGYPLITSKNIIDGTIDFSNVNLISKDDFEKINKRSKVDNGDILMPMIGTIGNSIIVEENYEFAIKNVALIKFKNTNIHNKFVNYILKSSMFERYVAQENRGGTQKFLSLGNIRSLKIPLPPLEEQQKIAKNLDLASELVKLYKTKQQELDKLIQSVFYDMFGDPVTNEKGWEVEELNTICGVRDGTHDSPKYIESGYPLITSKNISNGEIDFLNVNYISLEDLEKINKRSKVDNGDIIMPMIGTIGNPIIVMTDRIFAVKNVAIIKFGNSNMNNIFIKELLSSAYFDNAIRKNNKGGTQKFMSLGDIRKLKIPVPPLALQQKFADIVTKIEEQRAEVNHALQDTEMLYNSLMQEYFE